MAEEQREIVLINHGGHIEIELNEEKVYEGSDDLSSILRALGFTVEEIYVPLEFHDVDDEDDLDIDEY